LAVVVFSIVDSISYTKSKYWTKLIKQNSPNAAIFIVSNKCDLLITDEGCITDDLVANDYADAFYVKTSALTGQGIKELFERINVFADCDI